MAAVSAVVASHDGGPQVQRCLRHLQAQGLPMRELIVVDSGSSDGSPDAIRRALPAVRLIDLGSKPGTVGGGQSRATGGGDPVGPVGVHFVGTMVLPPARAKPGRVPSEPCSPGAFRPPACWRTGRSC